MNKNKYRVIFNAVRNLMIAVAENTSARPSPRKNMGSCSPSPAREFALDLLTLAVWMVTGSAAVFLPWPAMAAGIVADQTALASQRPNVTNASNGVPLVNIQTPSAAGVSRNTYSQFDVSPQGAILNNSKTNVQTQLGGWVQGNHNITGNTARVILSEVNSSHPSLLNGYVEIAGSRAQLVIANPAGISCDGCGFINANRTTLTTGTPIMNGGNLLGYRVGGGTIDFVGAGLDATQVNFTDVIARAVQVNAGIFANQLNVTTGSNQVNIDASGNQTAITAIAHDAGEGTPAFAVDISALGGMYAGKIRMVGTETGLGVRNASTIGASAGEVSITVDGLLQNAGIVNAKTDIQLDAVELENSQSIVADGNIDINLASDFTHSSELQAGGNLSLQTTGDFSNQSALLASQTLTVSAINISNTAAGEIIGLTTQVTAADTLINHGLIDGVHSQIKAATFTNTQTGNVFGDHLAIQATQLSNDAGAVIASREQLDIGVSSMENRTEGLIFSGGDIAIGGGLDGDDNATGSADTLINNGSTIEASGNAAFAVTNLTNLNSNLVTDVVMMGTASFDRFTPRNESVVWESSDYPGARIGNVNVEWRNAGPYRFREYTRYQGTKRFYETRVISSNPGQILSGGDMAITGSVNNSDSQIIAGGHLDILGATVSNLNTKGQTITSYNGTAYYYDWDGNDNDYDIDVIGAYNPANTVQTYNLSTTRFDGNATPTGSGTAVTPAPVPLLTSSLFQPNPDASAGYLIETNPRFANYRTWLSSDYMMQQLSFDPAMTQKRLGDGFYEQRLVREQVAQLTGRRFLTGYVNDEAQFQALMTSAVTQAGALQLVPGVALTATQIAQLTSDIVWLIEQEVTLPDGTVTKALAPQVYVKLQDGDLLPTTGIMSGNEVSIALSGDFNNQGTIAGREFVALSAANIHNLGGQIAGSTVQLTAVDNLNNIGGQVMAEDAMLLTAGNDITLRSTTQSSQNKAGASSFSRTNLDRVAGLYMSNPYAILVASAGNDVNLMAASIVNQGRNGRTQINAGQDMNLGTVTIAEQNSSVRNTKNYVKHGSSQEVGSVIQTSSDILFATGNSFNAKAANVTSDAGTINVSAAKDINVAEGRETSNFDTARKVKKSGTFSSTTKTQRDVFKSDTSASSSFSGEAVALHAGDNINIRGSNVVSDNGTSLIAGDNIKVAAARDTGYEFHERKTKKSGLSTSGASVTLGTQKLNTNQTSNNTSQTSSTVGSVNGDVEIVAGKTYTQKASDVLAPRGDIDISAQKVEITAAQNVSNKTQETKFKQSGLTISISNPVISAVQTAEQMKQAASDTSDSRMQALAAGAAVLAASNAYATLQATQAMPASGNSVKDAANQVGGVNISVSIGSSKSSSKSTQTITSAQSSQVIAGGDVNITASGDGGGSDIDIIGSQIKAGKDATLVADDVINLLAAKNTASLDSKNKSSSASVGAGIGTTSGLALTAGASKGKGKASGNDVTWDETQVLVRDKVTLESGADMNLIGAQVRGNQVVADVGTSGDGNLNIQSLQDTSTYDSKQKSAGISVSIPIGAGAYGGSISSSNTKIEAGYASVNEQAGIYAGNEGFQVSVARNTNMAGAVIASNMQAITDHKNSLTTETLTFSNIQNKAEYEAKGSSATIGGGLQAGLPQLSGAGVDSESGKSDSVTVSAISQGIVTVTNNDAQRGLTGKDVNVTVALLNRDVHVNEQGEAVDNQGNNTANTIAPIFDQEKLQKEIEAQIKITQAFSQEAPRALVNFATSKTQPYQDAKDYELIKARQKKNILLTNYELERLTELEAMGMTLEQAKATLDDPQARIDYENWNDNGNHRRAANILIAAISGNSTAIGTAVSKETLSWAADQMRQAMIEDSMKFPGICVSKDDCIDNKSGISVGVNGDNVKVAGGRIVLKDWCDEGRCEKDPHTISGYKENPDGTVIFHPTDSNGRPLTIGEFIEKYADKYELRSPLGGAQGGEGQMKIWGFQFDYVSGSFWDKLAEVYSGTHDTLNSVIWYDNLGNGKSLDGSLLGKIGSTANIANVGIATPFALSILLPPEVWNAVFSTVKLK